MSLNIKEWFGMIDLYTKHELLGGNAMNSRERVHAVLNHQLPDRVPNLSLIHISEPTRLGMISYAVFCLKKKKT